MTLDDLGALIALLTGGTMCAGGLYLAVSDAGHQGGSVIALFGRKVTSGMAGLASFAGGLVVMAASLIMIAGSGGTLSPDEGDRGIWSGGRIWPETEPNDEWSAPQPLSLERVIDGTAEPGDRDGFLVTLPEGEAELAWSLEARDTGEVCRLSAAIPAAPLLADLIERPLSNMDDPGDVVDGRPRGMPEPAIEELALVAPDETKSGARIAGPENPLFLVVEAAGDALCRYRIYVRPTGPAP